MRTILYGSLIMVLLSGCAAKAKPDSALLADADLLNRNVNEVTQIIIYDVFSPPVSSRIYAYTSLAAYEAVKFQQPGSASIAEKLHDFPSMPVPDAGKKYNYLLAATRAFFTVAEKITFSIDSLKKYQERVYANFESLLDKETFQNSIAFGEAVGKKVLERAAKDNYKQTRGMPKFLGSNDTGKWRPTAPDYQDAAEPYWHQMKTLVLDSSTQAECPPPPKFDMDKSSPYYKSLEEVYSISVNLTDQQREIARYWDDNPFVIEHSGHMMYANKKITPVGHWMGITSIACSSKKADAVTTAKAYALVSSAIFDAIICCWKTKYEYQHIRPITVINESIDANWQPLLQTPAFPEHPSGHSGISASAATVLTRLFGDNFSFLDTSDLQYIGMKRNFQSFNQAAAEASISRVYGGIHYRTGVDAGAMQGREVGSMVLNRFVK
ncbi:MAG: vanadium-dependent haloperoxidase [Flavisolibacter sp.]